MDAADVPRGGPVDGRIRGRVERFDEAGGHNVGEEGATVVVEMARLVERLRS